MKELGYQRWVVTSARKSFGLPGYGLKISHQTAVGIPDLLISLPGYCPCLIECKWLGRVVTGFSRKIKLTDKQRFELDRFNVANHNTGWVLVGSYNKNAIGVWVYKHQLYHPHVKQAVDVYSAYVTTKTQQGLIPLAQLFAKIGVRRL